MIDIQRSPFPRTTGSKVKVSANTEQQIPNRVFSERFGREPSENIMVGLSTCAVAKKPTSS